MIMPEINYLLHLLTCVLKDRQPDIPQKDLNWDNLYLLSKKHNVSNIVWYGLQKLKKENLPSPYILDKFYKDYKLGLAKEAAQYLEAENLMHIFEDKGISYMPLKGYVIKNLYPKPDMRVMSDIDILVKKKQGKALFKIMQDTGFCLENKSSCHDVYIKKPFILVELHWRLLTHNSTVMKYFDKEWTRARRKEDFNNTYQLTENDFFIYQIAHLAKHFFDYGTGIRSIMDVWVYLNHYKNELDWNYIKGELNKLKLYQFASIMKELGNVWFDSSSGNELFNDLTEFICNGGVYGIQQNHVLSGIYNTTKHNRSSKSDKLPYYVRLIFPTYHKLAAKYQVLMRFPFLYPALWVIRTVNFIFFRNKYALHILKEVNSLADEDIGRVKQMYDWLGL